MRTTLTILLAAALGIGSTACKKKEAPSAAGSAAPQGSAAPVGSAAPDPGDNVSCKDAAKAYTKAMAAAPGNILSDAKPDEGLIEYTAVSMEDYCEGEGGLVPWTATEKNCLTTTVTASSCFGGASLDQVNAGLKEVVTSALENKKKNEAAAGSAGSAK